MFGQQQQKSPFGTGFAFGGTSSTTFGAPTTTPTFGAAAPTGFGTTSSTPFAFGGASSTTPSFSFSSSTPQQQQQQQPFGTPSTFSTTFGSSASSSPFGQASASSQAKPLFGQSAPSTTFGGTPSLFGQPSLSSTNTGIFGSQAQTPSFGQQPQTTTPFGQAQPTTQSAFSFGGAGASSGSFDAAQGTGGVKYSTTQESDQQTTTTHYAITAMPAYQKKSFEELRYEDYKLGRKGQSGTTSTFTASSPFSATPSFSTTTQPQSAGLFGQQSSTFGTSTFGGTQPQTTSALGSTSAFSFGGTTPTTPAFGTAPTTFGAPATTTTAAFNSTPFGAATTPATTTTFGFGATAPPSANSPFGAAPATTSTFGTAPSPFGSLTASQPASTSFVSPSFGTQTSTAAPTTGFGIGATAPTTGTSLFGTGASLFSTTATTAASAPSFSFSSAAPTTTPSFSLTPAPLGTFGTGATGSSLFPTTASATPSFSLPTTSFSTSVTPGLPSSSFSTATPLFPTTPTTGFGTGAGIGTTTFAAAQVAVPTITSNPYGTVPLPMFTAPATPQTSVTAVASLPYTVTSTPEDKKRVVSNMYRVTPRSSTRIKPRGYGTIFQSTPEHADSKVLSPDSFVPRTSVKSLVIEDDSKHLASSTHTSITSPLIIDNVARDKQSNTRTPEDSSKDLGTSDFRSTTSPLPASRHLDFRPAPQWDEHNGASQAFPTHTLVTPVSSQEGCPKLTKAGYYTHPTLSELTNMSDEELSHVRDFRVGREGHGVVIWPGDINVRGLNLDEIIEFDTKSVTVYSDDSKKPPQGQGLNRSATIILENVWPVDRHTNKKRQDTESIERYRKVLERTTQKLGAHFKNYVPEKGEWTFTVDHFSRYGIDTEDEDDQLEEPKTHKQVQSGGYELETEEPEEQESMHEEELDEEEQEHGFELESPSNRPASAFSFQTSRESPTTEKEGFPKVIPRLLRLGVDASRMQGIFATEDSARHTLQNLSEYPSFIPRMSLSITPDSEVTLPGLPSVPSSIQEDLSGWQLQATRGNIPMHSGESPNFSRSFRVSFTPNGTAVIPSAKLGRILVVPPDVPRTTVVRPTVSHLLVASTPTKGTGSSFYVPLLDAHLRASRARVQLGDSCSSFELVDVIGNAKANIELFGAQSPVWTLVNALWGEDSTSESTFLNHKLALTSWLQDVVTPVVSNKVKDAKTVFQTIFAHLTGRQVPEAVALACRSKEVRLASLLAQLPVQPHNQRAIADQILLWQEYGAANFIDEELLVLYQLLAGDVEDVTNFFMRRGVIEDWKRCFSLHLWYKHPASSMISSALQSYDKAVAQGNAVVPHPAYTSGSTAFSDVTYQLLRLYAQVSDGSSSFSEQLLLNVIHPQNSTPHPMDYRLTWHLYSVLRSLPSLRVVPDVVKSQNIYIDYATQLEMEGLWIWALYIILQMPTSYGDWSIVNLRCKTVQDLLARHATEIGAQEETFLVQELHIPLQFIQEAKAWLALYTGNHDIAFVCLKNAGQTEAAHDEVVGHLATKWLIESQCRANNTVKSHRTLTLGTSNPLYEALESLHNNGRTAFDSTDGLYLEYLRMQHALPELKSYLDPTKIAEGTVAKQLMELYRRVGALSTNIATKTSGTGHKNSSSRDMLEYACLGDISSQVGSWMHKLHQSTMGTRDQASVVTKLRSLPIPTDVRASLFEQIVNDSVIAI